MKVILVLLCCVLIASAQPPDSLWSRTYGSSYSETCYALDTTSDGGFVLAGVQAEVNSDNDFWLVRAGAQGDTLWTRHYSGGQSEVCMAVRQAPDGGFILAGDKFYLDGNGDHNGYVVKTDASGNAVWTREFGGASNDVFTAVDVVSGGGYVLAGYTGSFGEGSPANNMWLVRLDANGDTLWTRTFGGTGNDIATSVQQTSDGGFALAGRALSFGLGILVLRTDANGDSAWSSFLPGEQKCSAMRQTSDSGFVLAGFMGISPDFNFWGLRTDAGGNTLWSRTFGGFGDDRCNAVRQTVDGGFIFAGYTSSFGSGDNNMWIVKTNAGGDSVWSRTFGGSGADGCAAIIQTADHGYALAGTTDSFGAGLSDFWLVRTAPESPLLSPSFTPQPSSFSLSSYPNPFNPSTELSFNLPRAGRVSLRVFDLLGQEVAVLEDGTMPAGTHRVMFNGSHLASGMYLARLEAGQFVQTEKLMLLK